MAIKLKPLAEQVVVITGASSGIGLATAIMAAKHGAKLVLAARNGDALGEAEKNIVEQGGEAIHVVADVASRGDVERIAQAAIDRFGRIDTWVNNAGTGIMGRIEQINDADHRRLFDTNFWGIVNGSTVALPYLRRQGGALINLGSVVSDMAMPMQGMYSASKHAIKGFTEALRTEMEQDENVSITLIKPAAIATPFFEHARNYTGKRPVAPSPVYRADDVALGILRAAEQPMRDVYVGGGGKAMSLMRNHAPKLADLVGKYLVPGMSMKDEPTPYHNDNLHQAGIDGRKDGDDFDRSRPSAYTMAVTKPCSQRRCPNDRCGPGGPGTGRGADEPEEAGLMICPVAPSFGR